MEQRAYVSPRISLATVHTYLDNPSGRRALHRKRVMYRMQQLLSMWPLQGRWYVRRMRACIVHRAYATRT